MNSHSRRNPLWRLAALGQSVWLDYIERRLIAGGGLARLIHEDAVAGVTSNPAIFEKAIRADPDYEAAIDALISAGLSAEAVAEDLVLEDVGRAAEVLRPLHEQTGGADGYVSIEISPHLAHDTERTVAEGERLWARLGRPNILIKVPATRAGVPAIRRLIVLGVNVNVTLLFSVARYREVAEAWLSGIEESARTGAELAPATSVASFFLSRIDTLVDRRLDAIGSAQARALRGEAAVACARLAYQHFKEIIAGARWRALAAQGVRPQRLLWASTSTKDPAYGDTKYVEPLIAPHTVNTLPPETLAAYRDHGRPTVRIEDDLEMAREVPARLAALGIDLGQVAQQLEEEGVRKFVEPYDRLLALIAQRRTSAK